MVLKERIRVSPLRFQVEEDLSITRRSSIKSAIAAPRGKSITQESFQIFRGRDIFALFKSRFKSIVSKIWDIKVDFYNSLAISYNLSLKIRLHCNEGCLIDRRRNGECVHEGAFGGEGMIRGNNYQIFYFYFYLKNEKNTKNK